MHSAWTYADAAPGKQSLHAPHLNPLQPCDVGEVNAACLLQASSGAREAEARQAVARQEVFAYTMVDTGWKTCRAYVAVACIVVSTVGSAPSSGLVGSGGLSLGLPAAGLQRVLWGKQTARSHNRHRHMVVHLHVPPYNSRPLVFSSQATRNFSSRFAGRVGSGPLGSPQHKVTLALCTTPSRGSAGSLETNCRQRQEMMLLHG